MRKLKEPYLAWEALRRLTISPVLMRSNPHSMRVDGTRNTILHLGIKFWKSVCFWKKKVIHQNK